MRRILSRWRALSAVQKSMAVGGTLLVIAGAAFAAYEHWKRPGDVSNGDVPFVQHHQKPKHKPAKPTLTNWPVYGLNPQRTRYLPAKHMGPPFKDVWHFPSDQLLEFSPILVKHTLYLIDKVATIHAINSNTGHTIWQHDLGSLNASSPAYSHGRLFAVTLDPGQVLALDPEHNGKLIWRHPLPGRSESSPVVYGGEVIIGCESGDVFALDAKDGSVDWQLHTGGAVKGGVSIDKGTAFFGNYAGQFYAVDAKTGHVEWQSSSEGLGFGVAGAFYSTPAIAFGRVYAGAKDHRVYSFSEKTGDIAWSHSTGDEIYPAPAVAAVPGTKPAVFIGSLDHHFYALDAKTGDEIWNQDVGGPVLGAASVVGRTVYVSVIGPNVGTYGFDVQTGKKKFYTSVGEYNPVISDGRRIYLTGGGAMIAYEPKHKGKGRKHGSNKRSKAHGGSKKQRGQGHGHKQPKHRDRGKSAN
jgi:outer membrane protein assembly factor BamB